VEEFLQLGVVRPCNSKFNSPMFLMAKKDGGIQIVQEFQAINQKTMVDKYSMRDVQECIDKIGRAGSSIFSETARLATPLNLLTTNTCEWKGRTPRRLSKSSNPC
jgi:hypothetical protein